jgi:uncharacterized protein YejL (UPF0352 family)
MDRKIEVEILEIRPQDPQVDRLLKHLIRIALRIEQNTAPHPTTLTSSIANVFSGDEMANNVLTLNVGQTSIDTITPLLADGVTPSGGALSNVTITFTDPSATFVINPDNTVTFTGVSATAGGTPASGLTGCTVTDTDGAVAQFSQSFTVLIGTSVPPSQLTQSIANVFASPAASAALKR